MTVLYKGSQCGEDLDREENPTSLSTITINSCNSYPLTQLNHSSCYHSQIRTCKFSLLLQITQPPHALHIIYKPITKSDWISNNESLPISLAFLDSWVKLKKSSRWYNSTPSDCYIGGVSAPGPEGSNHQSSTGPPLPANGGTKTEFIWQLPLLISQTPGR